MLTTIISVAFSSLHLHTDNQLAKHCQKLVEVRHGRIEQLALILYCFINPLEKF